MPRPTTAQLCTGTLITVATTVALLAVSGSTGVFEITVLVAFAIALGTLATALLMSAAAHRRPSPRSGGHAAHQSQPEYAQQT
ncbi:MULTISPECIES: hypothetical protein [Kitasatospora]|uniref:Uncharacterized protein n=2 Tax=Kitasatospora TaxID=2063 RepID=A0ABT1IY93_9ACTN|nr:hypothetical protein [Kitasatospora paracochleata]MCP2310119.1 hypothetical protein [Kitasatospora paracochleata]